MSNAKPFPCIKCCRKCTARFAENWAMRLCLKVSHWTGDLLWDDGSIPAGADASLDAFAAGVNSYFSNVAITWTDTTFYPATPNPADYVVCQVVDPSTYNVWMLDYGSGQFPTWSWDLVPITNVRLSIGAGWQRTHASPGSLPKICAPAWYWNFGFEVNGKTNVPIKGGSSAIGGPWFDIYNADGFLYPSGSSNTNQVPHCAVAEHLYTAPNTCLRYTQLQDATPTTYPNFINGQTCLRAVHTTGVPSLPACPP